MTRRTEDGEGKRRVNGDQNDEDAAELEMPHYS